MEPKSLRQISLSNYSYEQLRKLCFDSASNFSSVFDCNWDLWRDKAVADFNITPEFFDLIRVLPGPQRYLQIKSYFTLTPDLAVRVYPNGYIEGVFEAYRGYFIADLELNLPMIDFFYRRMTDEQREITAPHENYQNLDSMKKSLSASFLIFRGLLPFSNIEKNDKFWQKTVCELIVDGYDEALIFAVNYLSQRESEESFRRDLFRRDLFHAAISSGRVDFVDALLHFYVKLPRGFTIVKNVPKVNFWQPPAIIKLPKQYTLTLDWQGEIILQKAVDGFNTQILDFFTSLYGLSQQELASVVRPYYSFFRKDSISRPNPEDQYAIYLRFGARGGIDDFFTVFLNAEILIDFLQNTTLSKRSISQIVKDASQSSIALLQSILLSVDLTGIDLELSVEDEQLFPLACSLLEND